MKVEEQLNDNLKNVRRFSGFADIYNNARPQFPSYAVEVIKLYLEREPDTVVDLGCGTGLSTCGWVEHARRIIGVEPSEDMLAEAGKKEVPQIEWVQAFADDTGLEEQIADVVVCSQSFHWMNPVATLEEVNRILKPGGVFATIDCDWPPVFNRHGELAYQKLFGKVKRIEENDKDFSESSVKWDKNRHLRNIRISGYFSFSREIVFSNTEKATAGRIINLALSQGGLQEILKKKPQLIEDDINAFTDEIKRLYPDEDKAFDADFCYRMRIGVK